MTLAATVTVVSPRSSYALDSVGLPPLPAAVIVMVAAAEVVVVVTAVVLTAARSRVPPLSRSGHPSAIVVATGKGKMTVDKVP